MFPQSIPTLANTVVQWEQICRTKWFLCEISLFIFPNCLNLDKLLQMLLILVTNTWEFITSSRFFSLLTDEPLQRKQLQDTRMALQEFSGSFTSSSFSKLRDFQLQFYNMVLCICSFTDRAIKYKALTGIRDANTAVL